MRKELLAMPVILLMVGCGSSNPTAPTPAATPAPAVNFAGTYSGQYSITACGNTGDFATTGFCKTFTVGTVGPVALTLTQTGSNVTGTLTEGQIVTPVTGSVDGGGDLTLQGSGTFQGLTLQVEGWRTSLSNGQLVGSWNTVWTASFLSGMAQTVQDLTSVAKTASTAPAAATGSPNRPFTSYRDLMEAMDH